MKKKTRRPSSMKTPRSRAGVVVARGRKRNRPARADAAGRAQTIRLPRASKGQRAQFYEDPAVDQLMAIAVALAAEVSVAFERIDTLERLLEQAGVVSHAAIETFRPGEALAVERFARREQLIERVFQVLGQYEPTAR